MNSPDGRIATRFSVLNFPRPSLAFSADSIEGNAYTHRSLDALLGKCFNLKPSREPSRLNVEANPRLIESIKNQEMLLGLVVGTSGLTSCPRYANQAIAG